MGQKVTVRIEQIVFAIEEDHTVCKVLYSSSDPYCEECGGGWKLRKFPARSSCIDIMKKIGDFLLWDDYDPLMEFDLN